MRPLMNAILRPGACIVALAMAMLLALHPARAGDLSARRVVAAGGVITEIAYALGRAHMLVGVDSTSQFPPEALKTKPDIGYVRALSAEGILSLRPDRVLAIEGAGPPDVLKLIQEAGVQVHTLPEDLSEEGVLKRIRMVGDALGATADAQALSARVEQGFAALAAKRGRIGKPTRILFVLSFQNGRVMVGGRNSSADAIIRLAGGTNAAAAIEGFKPISDEGILAAAPDVIVMMERGGHAVSAETVFAHPAMRLVPAARNRALVTMDGLFLLGFGPRTAQAAGELMEQVGQKAASSGPTSP